MLVVSDNASGYLKTLLNEVDAPEEKCVRMEAKGNDLQLVIGDQLDSDEKFEHENRVVLVVDQELAQQLDGTTVDVTEEDGQARLVLTGPKT